ncbi:Hypothetical_protein [Hexamita inflata]|uniref:Hypothetical_protein n=1 Tax=Hexamita inflata TaxID=28002 RepID=A0AA86V6G0_9EUKA|nr:Hypothetical protein HINF_LOCUS65896 [Hexamita inflata]
MFEQMLIKIINQLVKIINTKTHDFQFSALCQSGQMTDTLNRVVTMSVYNSTHIFFVIAAQPPLSSLISVCEFCQKLQRDAGIILHFYYILSKLGRVYYSSAVISTYSLSKQSEATIYVNKWAVQPVSAFVTERIIV